MPKQAEDGTSVGEVCRKTGISEATFYVWRKKYAGLMPSGMRRLRQFEEENVKLKRLVAALSLDQAMLLGKSLAKVPRPDRRRQLVDDVGSPWQVSIRRACGVLRAGRSSYHYRRRRAEQTDLKKRVKEIAETRVRYGR